MLRMNCPCSECRSQAHMRSATYVPMLTAAAITIRAIDLVGSSALYIVWEDGHDRSIYPYALIRELAPPKEKE